jgi:hypothetical protein
MRIDKNAGLLNSVDFEMNHKVCEEPAVLLPDGDNDFIPPRTEVEQFLVTIWAELLRCPRVGIRDNFFDLGGYSLLATQMVAKIYQRYHIELPVSKIIESPTIFSLAREIEAANQCMPHSNQPTEIRQSRKAVPVTGIIPLTPSQAWFLNVPNFNHNHFNIIRVYEVDSHFNPDILQQVLIYLWKIHDALRARFIRRGDKWEQMIDGPEQSAPDFHVYNLTDVPIEDEGRMVKKYVELFQGNVNFMQGPLMLAAYLDFGPERQGRIILKIHHFLIDAISMSILDKDLQTAYQQLFNGQAIDIPEKGVSIKEWAELLHEYFLSEGHYKTIDYLLTLPWDKSPSLPLDFPQNHVKNVIYSTKRVTVSLTKEETDILIRKVSVVLNVGIENVLLWALTKVISEWTGSKLVEITLMGNGRDMIPDYKYLDLSRTVGYLSTRRTLLLENIKSADWSKEIVMFCEQVDNIPNNGYDYFLAASLNDDSRVIRKLQKIRNIEKYISYNEICFNYRGAILENNESSELKLVYQSVDKEPKSNRLVNINIVSDITNRCLNNIWVFSNSLYKSETIERLADKYIRIIKDLVQKLSG